MSGNEDIRRAFLTAAGGNLRLDSAGLVYGSDGARLSFAGWSKFGTPFAVITEPVSGDVLQRAEQAALDLIHAPPATMPQGDPPAQRPLSTEAAADPLSATLTAYTARIVSAQPIARALVDARKQAMSRFGSIGDRIKTKRDDREKWAEAMHARLDAVDAHEPAIRQATEEHVKDAIEGELASMDAELRQLSNALPLPLKG